MQQKFHRHISAQHSWPVPNLLRGRPTDLSSSFLHSQCPKQWCSYTGLTTKKLEPVTRHIFGLFEFFSKYATFELSLMSNDENKFLPIFQILHIKNA